LQADRLRERKWLKNLTELQAATSERSGTGRLHASSGRLSHDLRDCGTGIEHVIPAQRKVYQKHETGFTQLFSNRQTLGWT